MCLYDALDFSLWVVHKDLYVCDYMKKSKDGFVNDFYQGIIVTALIIIAGRIVWNVIHNKLANELQLPLILVGLIFLVIIAYFIIRTFLKFYNHLRAINAR